MKKCLRFLYIIFMLLFGIELDIVIGKQGKVTFDRTES